METLYIKQQLKPCTEFTYGYRDSIVAHHEVVRHNFKTYRIIIQATKRPHIASYARVELLADDGWKLFIEPLSLGVDFESYVNVLTNQNEKKDVRAAKMDNLVDIFKEYIKIF